MREWAIQNAERWVRDYHVDGLRLDATHAIFDESTPHVARRARRRGCVRRRAVDARSSPRWRPATCDRSREWGHDAQWGDELHHAVHVLLTGEHDGYYADYGTRRRRRRASSNAPTRRGSSCARRTTTRWATARSATGCAARKLRLAAFCAILAPGVPLLFMGEEYDESHPFLFFTDHIDPEIARRDPRGPAARVRSASPRSPASDVPDPQARRHVRAVASSIPSAGDDEHRALLP